MRIAYIGLGANLPSKAGAPDVTLTAAVERMQALGRITARSRLYSTEPVGFAEQPRFLNAAVALETELEPRALLNALLGIELEFGRDRSAGIENGPRTLDLDILLIEGIAVSEPGLEVPHPRLQGRAFALVPLNDVAPDARDPKSEASVAEWLRRLFPDSSDANYGVSPIQSGAWHPGTGGIDVAGGERARASAGDADR